MSDAPTPPPEFAPIVDDVTLPRVLLIGDSISLGYTLPVRRILSGKANVQRPSANCGPTSLGLREIDRWLGATAWDVIHFNFGLHDLKHIDSNGQPVAPAAGQRQVSPEAYERNLQALVDRLKRTRAALIWATITPIPLGAECRLPGDEVRYNRIAATVMTANGIEINDLYGFALPRLGEIQEPNDVHFKPLGSEALAVEVAQRIARRLPDPKTSGKTV